MVSIAWSIIQNDLKVTHVAPSVLGSSRGWIRWSGDGRQLRGSYFPPMPAAQLSGLRGLIQQECDSLPLRRPTPGGGSMRGTPASRGAGPLRRRSSATTAAARESGPFLDPLTLEYWPRASTRQGPSAPQRETNGDSANEPDISNRLRLRSRGGQSRRRCAWSSEGLSPLGLTLD